MNFNKKKVTQIEGDASFRKFYRKKENKKNSIILYSKKEKNKNLLNYDSINKLLLKNKILAPKLLSENFSKNFIEIEDLGKQTIFDIFKKKKVNRLKVYKKILVVLPNQVHPTQFHKKKEETFNVLHGKLILILNDKKKILNSGDVVTIKPGQTHKFYSKKGCIIEEISTTHFKSDSFYIDKKIDKNKSRKTMANFWI